MDTLRYTINEKFRINKNIISNLENEAQYAEKMKLLGERLATLKKNYVLDIFIS